MKSPHLSFATALSPPLVLLLAFFLATTSPLLHYSCEVVAVAAAPTRAGEAIVGGIVVERRRRRRRRRGGGGTDIIRRDGDDEGRRGSGSSGRETTSFLFLFDRPPPPPSSRGGWTKIMMPPTAVGSVFAMRGAVLGDDDSRKIERTTSSGGDHRENNEQSSSLRRAIERLASIIVDPPARDDSIDRSHHRGADASSSSSSSSAIHPPPSSSAVVHIVGTGLSPTLMNLPLSILLVLSRADVVLYDSLGLSREDIRRIVPERCDVVCVGKRGEDAKSWKQEDIDRLLLRKASEPPSATTQSSNDDGGPPERKCVVRLKGGDPFLFGRTRTEIDTLRSNGIPYTYTPGISSCVAGPHLGGIPLTDPSLNCQSFGVWSGTDAFGRSRGLDDDDGGGGGDDGPGKRWRGALDVDVLVFLMIGRLDKLDALCRSIANHGDDDDDDAGRWNENSPCAIIQNAGGVRNADESTTLPIQKVWRSSLGNIVRDIKAEDATRSSVSPAVFVVGATASLDLLSQDSQS